MLRLASRSTATSATPHRICVARTRRPVTSSTLTAAREEHMQGWQPGDPIQFASRPEREERAVRGWSPGDPIRFGVVEENIEAGSGASSSRAGSPAKKQARKSSTPSPRRPSEYSIATRATGPSSLRTNSPFDRSSASWLSHRFEPPSPSPSVGTGAHRDDSFDSTACFSPSRHGAPQPAMQPHLPQSPSASLEPPPALSFRPVSSSTRSPRGVTQVSQAELDDLVSGVDFEEDLPSSSDAAPLVAPGSSLDPRELDNLVSGIDFSDIFDATDFDDSIEILAQPRPTTSRTPSSPTVPIAASVSRTAPPTSHRFISSPPRPATPQFPAASRTPLRSSNAIIDLTNSSPSLTPPSMRGFATTSKAAMDWDDLLDDEDLHFHSGKPLPSAPAAETERITPAPAKPSAPAKPVSKRRKSPTARSRSAAADKENDPKATKRKGRPLSATALRNQASAEKDAAARAKWARTFNFREWAPRDIKVIYSTDADEVRQVLSTMEGPFGFDLEWNIYGPPSSRRAALVQVCDRKTVLLVHVARMWGESGKERKGFAFPDALKEFIEDDSKIKLGVNIGGDATKLKKDFDHSPRGILDLNSIRLRHDPETIAQRRLVSLQQLVGSYLDCYLPKDSDIRCSRWHERLSDQQLEYAANDVYSSLMVAHAIHSLADLSLEEAHADLRSLVDSPLARNVVSRQAPPAAVDAEYASPREAALAALSPRRLELFGYFSDSTLSLGDIHAKMNETGSMKPLSVVWTLLSTYAELRTKGVEDGFDVSRLRDFALAVEEDWSPRFLAEHGALVSELRRVAPAQSKASG